MSFDLRIAGGDLALGPDGDFVQVSNTDKLVQDVYKICISQVGSNVFFPWYGSMLGKGAIGQVFSFSMTETQVKSQLTTALQNLQTLQKGQAGQGQAVTASELLAAVKDIQVSRSTSDPTTYQIILYLLSKDLSNLTLDQMAIGP